jgi:Uma2 family endonuclease
MNAMAEAVSPAVRPASPLATEQRVILHNVSWETYERLLIEHEGGNTRFTYDRGDLEIMVLWADHENYKDKIVMLINNLAVEFGIDFESFGSTTFQREDLARGFEPDACFYFQNVARVRRKKRLDLTIDPPPDLVIEIDIAHPSLNKFPIFAAVGVPEVWRYDGSTLTIFTLKNGNYQTSKSSTMLSGLTGQMIARFLQESQTMSLLAWVLHLREWVRTHQTQRKPQS